MNGVKSFKQVEQPFKTGTCSKALQAAKRPKSHTLPLPIFKEKRTKRTTYYIFIYNAHPAPPSWRTGARNPAPCVHTTSHRHFLPPSYRALPLRSSQRTHMDIAGSPLFEPSFETPSTHVFLPLAAPLVFDDDTAPQLTDSPRSANGASLPLDEEVFGRNFQKDNILDFHLSPAETDSEHDWKNAKLSFDTANKHLDSLAAALSLPPDPPPRAPLPVARARAVKPRTYQDATPSKHCHICSARPSTASPHVVCANLRRGTCRKTVCAKCFARHAWDIRAARTARNWRCPHCSAACPRAAQCFIYGRTTARRRQNALRARVAQGRRDAAVLALLRAATPQPTLPIDALRFVGAQGILDAETTRPHSRWHGLDA